MCRCAVGIKTGRRFWIDKERPDFRIFWDL